MSSLLSALLTFIEEHSVISAVVGALLYLLVAVGIAYCRNRRRFQIKTDIEGTGHLVQELEDINYAYECFGDTHDADNPTQKLEKLRSGRAASCTVIDVEERAQKHPVNFRIPTQEERSGIAKGDWVRLILSAPGGEQERVWVRVINVKSSDSFEGTILHELLVIPAAVAKMGDSVSFSAKHVSRLGLCRGHDKWYDPTQTVIVGRDVLRAKPIRHAVFSPLADEPDDSGWMLLCGDEEAENPEHYMIVTPAAAMTLAPAFEQLYLFPRQKLPNGSMFTRASRDEPFKLIKIAAPPRGADTDEK